MADEYGCQLFRANCYSPSARSVNQRDWRRVAALRVARGVPRFPRVVPPLLFSSLSPRELFNRPGKQLYPFDRVNCTQTHDWRQGSWKGWWVESLARTKPPFRMYVRSGSRVCCLFVWSLSIICGFRVTLLKPTHCFLLIIINSLTCYFLKMIKNSKESWRKWKSKIINCPEILFTFYFSSWRMVGKGEKARNTIHPRFWVCHHRERMFGLFSRVFFAARSCLAQACVCRLTNLKW